MKCKHDRYWRGIYGYCMACRAESAEAMRDELAAALRYWTPKEMPLEHQVDTPSVAHKLVWMRTQQTLNKLDTGTDSALAKNE